jgi:hypothetical protein
MPISIGKGRDEGAVISQLHLPGGQGNKRGQPKKLRGFKDPQLPNSSAFMNQPYPLRALRTRN